MTDPFRKGIAENLCWKLSLGVAAAAFFGMGVGLDPLIAFILLPVALINAGVFHHLADADVPRGIKGSPDPLSFRLGLITTGAVIIFVELAILVRIDVQVALIALGVALIAAGILFPTACTRVPAMARFSPTSRDIRFHLLVSGALCIAGPLFVLVN